MNILAFVFVGLIAGYLAGEIVEEHDFGALSDTVVAIVGALVGGIYYTSSQYEVADFWAATMTAALGAVTLLLILNLLNLMFTPRKRFMHL